MRSTDFIFLLIFNIVLRLSFSSYSFVKEEVEGRGGGGVVKACEIRWDSDVFFWLMTQWLKPFCATIVASGFHQQYLCKQEFNIFTLLSFKASFPR